MATARSRGMSGPQLHAVGLLFSNYRGHQLVAVKLETHHPVAERVSPQAGNGNF